MRRKTCAGDGYLFPRSQAFNFSLVALYDIVKPSSPVHVTIQNVKGPISCPNP